MWRRYKGFFGKRNARAGDTGGRWAGLMEMLRSLLKDRLRLTKGVLVVILVCLVGVFAHDLVVGHRTVAQPLHAETGPAEGAGVSRGPGRPLAHYSNMVDRRNLFSASAASVARDRVVPTADEDTGKKLDNLELLGIFLDEKPQAIIEDQETQRTYFLYEGDTFQGMVVEKILKGKIILKHQSQTFELVL